ncbi:MAG: hypothetical protein M1820_000018 [Bogoriella megaspora]|nr:MAG: hypothetical protein M1820_000018 [Bogoriella megaspora]
MQSGRNTIAAPRAKRAGEDFTSINFPDSENEERSSKKPRFDYRNPSTLAPDAPEEDAILELDEIGKGGAQTKRNAINLDGYSSDSSNENFDTRANEKAKLAKQESKSNAKSKDEDENDMFADLDEINADGDEDEDLVREGKKPKKGVRFMDDSDIEGEVTSSKSGGHVSANILQGRGRDKEIESSSESGEDEERDRVADDMDEELGAGSKKKHAPKLDAFNMRQEAEEGKFDESGNYIRKATDPDAVHDSWLDGFSKKDFKQARDAEEKREQERKERNAADDAILTSELLRTLISHMEIGETVFETLARLNKEKGVKKPKWQKNKKKNTTTENSNGTHMEIDSDLVKDDSEEIKRKEVIEAITGAADQLYSRGQPEIYEAEREILIRQYTRETGEDWNSSNKSKDADTETDTAERWEYRWSDSRDGGESHGPYDSAIMVAWKDAGYFGEGVVFKRVGEPEWSSSLDVSS